MLQKTNMTLVPDFSEAPQSIDLRNIINFVWRQWKFIGSILALCVLIAVLYLVTAVPRYTATSQILLDLRRERPPGTETFATEVNLDAEMIESQIALIRSTVFLRRVAEKERLIDDPEFKAKAAPPDNQKRQPTITQRDAIPPELMGIIENLKSSISVGRLGASYVLNINVTTANPIRAARISNSIADSFVIDKLEARYESAQRASEWLSDRVTELRTRMGESEEAIQKFKKENNLILSSPSLTLNEQQLGDLNQKLVAARTDLAEKKARLDLVTSASAKGGDVKSLLPEMINSPTVTSLRTQLAALTQKEADLSARYTAGHPLIVNVRSERRDIERALANEVQKLAATVTSEYQLAKSKADSLEKTIREVTGQSDYDSSAVLKLREMEKTAAVDRTIFEDFLKKAKITQEQSTFEAREARILTPAVVPTDPSSPQRYRVLGIGAMIGLLLGGCAAFLRELFNSGFTVPKQVEDMLNLPMLASVMRLEDSARTVNGNLTPIHLYAAAKPLSRFSESIRSIRSGIQMTDVDRPPKVIQVTSVLPSEGKTTLSSCLAVSASQSGLKTLYIDGDLRRPSASKIMGVAKEQGLVDVLVGNAQLQDVIKYDEAGKFWFLGSGSKTQNPADLLAADRLKTLMDYFRQAFDYVVIDSAPAGPVIDPIIVSKIVDTTLLVIKWGGTHREVIQECVKQLSVHRRIAGVVFNSVVEREAQKYGKYAYSYYYGKNYYNKYYSG